MQAYEGREVIGTTLNSFTKGKSCLTDPLAFYDEMIGLVDGLQLMFTWTLARPLTWSPIVSLLSNWQNMHQVGALKCLDLQAQRMVSNSSTNNSCLVTSSVLHGPYLGQCCSMPVLTTWVVEWSAVSANLQISHCGEQLIC